MRTETTRTHPTIPTRRTGPVTYVLVVWAILRRPRLRWARRVEAATGAHVSWSASVVLGVTLIVFLLYEAQVLTGPEARTLQWVFGAVGAGIAALPFAPPVRRDLRVEADVQVYS